MITCNAQTMSTGVAAIDKQNRLSEWLRNHIVKVDTKLKDCVTGKVA